MACIGETPCLSTANASLFESFYQDYPIQNYACLGQTPCLVTYSSPTFRSLYQNYDVHGWCEQEPFACWQNGGTACPPDCGGNYGASMIEYGCQPVEGVGVMGNMDCMDLYNKTGVCFDDTTPGADEAGTCTQGCPPDCGGYIGAAMMIYGCEQTDDGLMGMMDCSLLKEETGVCFNVSNLTAQNAGTCTDTGELPDLPTREDKNSRPLKTFKKR
tara:strand:+ start:258 stop:902 length:645 start_codon:yes stop_codon:yes gene_type:complete